MASPRYDCIIVGGGSAGSALANRLSTDPATRVLVIEAGRPDYRFDVFIHMPSALTFPIGSRYYDWMYESEPEPFMNGRKIYHARGKVLGGSSSINGQIFQRGNPLDYERWAADPGMASWDYAHCLPYFKKMENCLAAAADDPWRGHDGPLVLERGPATNPLFTAFFAACQEAGYHLTEDVNGYRQEGFAPFDRNIHRGRRLSAAQAYLRPVRGRKNLTLRTRTFVTGVVFDGRRAVAVDIERQGGGTERIEGGEIILAGGAINTPQLLQLSGVGRAADLEALGIPVVADLPGSVPTCRTTSRSTSSTSRCSRSPCSRRRRRSGAGRSSGRSGSSCGAAPARPTTSRVAGSPGATTRSPTRTSCSISCRSPSGTTAAPGRPGTATRSTSGRCTSDARGSVALKSVDPHEHPALRFNYLSTEQDRREWVEAIHVARRILNQPAMDAYNGGETSPGPIVTTDEEIRDWVARDAETALHPSCTARMGVDDVRPGSAHDAGPRARWLRVVDASAMPYVTNGNIYAPVMMLAEKSADLILGTRRCRRSTRRSTGTAPDERRLGRGYLRR